MHGNSNVPFPSTPFPALLDPSQLPPEPTYYDISVATHKQIATLQSKLDQKLGPEYISQRPGPGGGPKLTYAEGWKIINLANEVFGFNGWNSSICTLSIDYLDPVEEGRRWNCGVSAVVRVTLRDGIYHEDIGYGIAENIKSKGAALDKCKKEAVTDAIKRTLRNFGNLLGNCLYDKHYTQEVVKMKVQPPKFDRTTLHRRPEFEEGNSRGSKPAPAPVHNDGNKSSTADANISLNNQPVECEAKPSIPRVSKAPLERNIPPPPARNNNPKSGESRSAQESKIEYNHSTDKEEVTYFNSEDDAYYMELEMENGGGLEEDRPIHSELDYEDSRSTIISVTNPLPQPGMNDTNKKNYQGQQEMPPPLQLQRPQVNIAVKSEQTTPRASNCLGGFHFPPPIDRSDTPATSHVTGVKRGVDSISDPTANHKREAVIRDALRAHRTHNSEKLLDQEGKAREPLAPLRGNDAKRMRH